MPLRCIPAGSSTRAAQLVAGWQHVRRGSGAGRRASGGASEGGSRFVSGAAKIGDGRLQHEQTGWLTAAQWRLGRAGVGSTRGWVAAQVAEPVGRRRRQPPSQQPAVYRAIWRSWSQFLDSLPLPNIKWICPTAPKRPVVAFGGFPCTAWFDVEETSLDGRDDIEGLDASAAHGANLLSFEPSDVRLGIGGFSMGAATALHSAACYGHGRFTNGIAYPITLSVVVGLSGWLPCSRTLRSKIESSQTALKLLPYQSFSTMEEPMRLSPTGTVRGRLIFCNPQDSSIHISKPTMGTD